MKTPQLEHGYTRIANEILEALSKINLSSYQNRILYFIFRKTYGYGKKEDWISVSQIVEATGIKQSHVSRTKKELLLRKLIYTPNGIKIAFQKDYKLWRDIPNEVYRKKNIPLQDRNIPPEDKNIPPEGHTKDTIQKKLTKETTGLVEQITYWAYNRARVIPSCSKNAFRKSVELALNRVGEWKVNRAFEMEDNAIQFLVNIKNL